MKDSGSTYTIPLLRSLRRDVLLRLADTKCDSNSKKHLRIPLWAVGFCPLMPSVFTDAAQSSFLLSLIQAKITGPHDQSGSGQGSDEGCLIRYGTSVPDMRPVCIRALGHLAYPYRRKKGLGHSRDMSEVLVQAGGFGGRGLACSCLRIMRQMIPRLEARAPFKSGNPLLRRCSASAASAIPGCRPGRSTTLRN